MHDAVTNPSSSTNFYSDDIVSPNQTKSPVSLNPTSRDMLSPSASSRRVQATAANSGRHWRYINGTGQLVDSSGDWDLSDELVKLQIADSNGDPNAQMRTPPQPKANVGVVGLHEASPLETASEASVDSGSPIPNEQSMGFASHSRGSSADTTASSHVSSASQTLRAGPYTPMKVAPVAESRNRPHSYSGGISAADLSRLQNAGGSPGAKGDSWSSPNRTPERQAQAEQPTYPSLVNQNGYMQSEDVQADYTQQQRRFSPATGPALQYNRPANVITNQPYRQPPPRGFNPQVQVPGVVSSPTNFAYTTPIAPPPPMPLSSSQQQLYDMMLATPPLDNPTMVRLQQQHNSFRGGHQHSASDPASLRDPATLALINSSMQQAFAAGQMYPPTMPPPPALAMFANQFYGAPQEAYPNAELAMMARLQAQYSGAYGVPVPAEGVALSQAGASGPSSAAAQAAANAAAGNGPSANNRKLGLYKTELCRSWEEKGSCRYGTKCQFAHGEEELRKVQRHPKYKTEICRTFWVSGSCPYGKRCCFIHTELPASGAPPGSEGAPPPSNPDTRPRSGSTNSDPNEMSTSLLARISAKRNQEGALNGGPGSVSTTPPSAGFGARPGSLRVDTSVIDTTSTKQNKSAYPTFAHNGILMPAGEDAPAMSPGPVTAAPDFGRHASARLDIVGAHQRIAKTSNVNPNVRHSFSGSEVQLDFNNVTTPTAANQYGQSPSDAVRPSRINGHVRSGSAGNWGSATRSAHLSAYPLSSIPGGELKANSPWADYNVSSRMTEKTWA